MKSNKTLDQNLLIENVIQQLNSHFTPKISIIKVNIILSNFNEEFSLYFQDCIDNLIKNDYLERSADNGDFLCYIA